MTKKGQSAERQEAIDKLRETLKPGDTVYTVLRHVSRSGMQREISLKISGEDGEVRDITWSASVAMNDRVGKRDGIVVGGCGMDMGFSLVYNLGYALWPTGYGCAGEKCRSTDHSNGDRDRTPHLSDEERTNDAGEMCTCHRTHWHNDGGYALTHRWL